MRLWTRLILVSGLIFLCDLDAAAQSPTFHSATELVNLNVTVVAGDARVVTGLTSDQFEIFEDGVRQELQFFAPGDLAVDVILMLDTSGSMARSLPLVQQAALRFVRALRPVDRACVMSVADHLTILQPLTNDVAALERAIAYTKTGGGTLLYASIHTALTELAKIRRDNRVAPRRQALVVMSDGVDTSSAFRFDELLSTVRRQAVPIYTIAPRASKSRKLQREVVFGETTFHQDYELRKLATETGGRAFFPTAIEDLTRVYDDIANELAHQYALGYQSSNHALNGSFRRIALRITMPGVKWRTRAGYLADREVGDNDSDPR